MRLTHACSPRTALLAELPILLVLLGLLCWALSVLAQGLRRDTSGLSFYHTYPVEAAFTYTRTQTVTGYRTSSVSPARVSTRSASTYRVIGIDRHTTTHTNQPYTYTISPATFGIDPTGTKTRVYTTSGIQQVGHYVVPTGISEGSPATTAAGPTPTSAPLRRNHHEYARQVGSDAGSSSSNTPDQLYDYNFWDLPSDTRSFTQYATVTINHGFEGHFFEAGFNYLFHYRIEGDPSSGRTGGYSASDLTRIRALTALVLIALIAVIGRVACSLTLVLLSSLRGRFQKNNDPSPVHHAYKRIRWLSLACTALLLLTYIPFWAIYGSWTNRNATVQKADAVFRADDYLRDQSLETMLSTTPWNGTTSALIVFWTLAVLTSFLNLALIVMARARISSKAPSV